MKTRKLRQIEVSEIGMGCMGSASAFTIAGPATRITNLRALKIVFGMKRFLLYLAFQIYGIYCEKFRKYKDGNGCGISAAYCRWREQVMKTLDF